MGTGVVSTTLAEQWAALVSAALLGTDRRPAPPAPPGPLADLTPGGIDVDDGSAVLDQIAMITAMRRAGVRPAPAAALLVPAPEDARPLCGTAAVDRLHDLLAEWPQLVDQWLELLERSGRRLPPDVAVDLLARWRNDPRRRAAVAEAAGPVTEWLVELFPDELAPGRPSRPARSPSAPPPLPRDVASLAELDAGELAATLAGGLERGGFGVRHRAPLVQLLIDLPAERLAGLPEVLERAGTNPTTMGLALLLADLARTRLSMIEELTP